MKDELRYKYKIKRKYFQHSRREVADGAISDNVVALFGDKNTFLIYYSFGSEADTKKLIDRLISLGKRVFLPRVEGKNMVAAEYCAEGLKKSALGVCEPQGQAYEGQIDVIICPLLAVNSRGYRVGYGGGYYDRYLKNSTAVKAGIGYDFQLTDEFEEDGWDEPLDILITERGIYRFGN